MPSLTNTLWLIVAVLVALVAIVWLIQNVEVSFIRLWGLA